MIHRNTSIAISIVSFFFLPSSLFGQGNLKNTFIHQALCFDGTTFGEIWNENSIEDKIHCEGNITYIKRKIDNNTSEKYHRVNDTIYYYRKFVNNKIKQEGPFKINLKNPTRTDTSFIACSYGSYEEEIIFNHYYMPSKTGDWKIRNSENQLVSGEYLNDKKHGTWTTFMNSNIIAKVNFLQGDTIGIFDPSADQIARKLKLIQTEKYIVWKRLDSKTRKMETELSTNRFILNYGHYTEVSFKTNNKVTIKEINKKEKVNTKSKTGQYSIEGRKLTIRLPNQETTCIDLEYFGRDMIKGNNCSNN